MLILTIIFLISRHYAFQRVEILPHISFFTNYSTIYTYQNCQKLE